MASGIRIFACEATLNYYNLTEDDLAFGVETVPPGSPPWEGCRRARDGVTSSSDESHSPPARFGGTGCQRDHMPLHASADTTTHNDSPVLIYIYSPECGACRQFDREVGPIYEKTAESLALPLERVLIDEWQADRHQLVECASAEVIGTPTFLQIRDCQELDRITGYSDAELFWLGHRRMMNRIASDQ